MSNPSDFLYSETHEWVQNLGDGICRVGLTDFAQSEMGDIVFISLPEVGDSVEVESPFGEAESVKAVEDLLSPVSGEVVAINESLEDAPEQVNASPYEAWLIEVKLDGDLPDTLLDASAYEEICH